MQNNQLKLSTRIVGFTGVHLAAPKLWPLENRRMGKSLEYLSPNALNLTISSFSS